MLFGIIITIVAVIVLLIVWELYTFSTVELHYKDMLIAIRVRTPLYKKDIELNMDKPETPAKADGKESQQSGVKKKISEIKERVFNSEKGFDTDELKNVFGEFADTYSYVFGIIRKFFGKLRHKIHIKQLFIKLEYGTDNPANTGFIYGSVWNVVGLVYPWLTRYFHMEYPSIDITPDFYGKRFEIEARSIIKVRAVHIIRAGLSSLLIPSLTYLKDKIKKGRGKNGR